MQRIPITFARGGTSRGAYLLADDLPGDPRRRDELILALYGSPDTRQINGIGGGDPLTSKVAVVDPSDRDDADVDYTFGQVGIATPQVFWTGNCGNMSSGVGPFAIAKGLVSVTEPETVVRIYNTNTDTVLVARVPVRDGEVVETGDTYIAGVPTPGAPIYLDFGDCSGTVSGVLLPSGAPVATTTLNDGSEIAYSLVDAATPFVFVRAADVGARGTESAAEIDADQPLRDRLEQLRAAAGRVLGVVADGEVAAEVSPGIPRIVMVSAPIDYETASGATIDATACDVVARQLAMQQSHKTYSVTGTLCTAIAANVAGTVVHETAKPTDGTFRIGHPDGVIEARVDVQATADGYQIREASLVRTAHMIMEGHARVPVPTE